MSDYFRQHYSTNSFTKGSWVVLGDVAQRIKQKVEAVGVPLKDWDINIYRGILTGYNEAFIIDSATRDKIIKASPNSVDIIRPILRGKDIHRYYYDINDLYILFIPWHFPLHENENIKGVSLEAELAFKSQYTAVYDHLFSHEEALKHRNAAETGIRYEWYALQRFGANYWKDFSKKKIVWGNLALRGSYALVGENIYINAPSAFIPTDSLFLLAILNSKIADFYIKQLGITRNGGYFEYKPMFVEELPVPHVSIEVECQFSILVNQIINANNVNIIALNNQIDELAFDLYGLTLEERNLIQTFSKNYETSQIL